MFKKLPQENNGLVEIENYKNFPLPEDYEITEVLDDVLMAEYADLSEDGTSVMRNGIHLPQGVIDQRAWRVARVILAGPKANLKPGQFFIFPGDKGMQGMRTIKKNNKMVIFINEDRIFAICEPKKEE